MFRNFAVFLSPCQDTAAFCFKDAAPHIPPENPAPHSLRFPAVFGFPLLNGLQGNTLFLKYKNFGIRI
ncbi:SURP and G-patch domain-containing protein [Dirofilaria immitis]